MKRTLWIMLAVLWASCSTRVDGALVATVDFEAGTQSTCVQLLVRTNDGTEVRSDPMPTDRSRPLKIGIAKAGLPNELRVFAIGYSDSNCMTPTVPLERSMTVPGTFKRGSTVPLFLTLTRQPDARDDDGDSYTSKASGGDDCNDADPAVHPGAIEVCTDGKDNDCDEAADCEEAACSDKACGPILGASCVQPRCAERSCNDDVDNDGDGTRDCADSDCAGRECRNGGTCQGGTCKGATSEKDLCGDNADNDGDAKIDCLDPDCVGSLCNPGDACVTGARCNSSLACADGLPVTCNNPGTVCLKPSGMCNPLDGGCVYPPDPGKACNDANGCTSIDVCSSAGACVGAVTVCVSQTACARNTGCTADAGCLFVPATGDSCDDGDACTSGDACKADAGCGGTTVSCAANECQTFSNQCGVDGGCVFASRDAGLSCDGGLCNGSGACIPLFPYPPSNFTESMLPTPGGPTVLNCSVVLDSHSSDGGVGFNGWCGNPAPPYRLIPQAAGFKDAVLVSFSELEVGLDASVRLQGDRPVIFATTGSMRVLGELLASSGSAACTDGGAGGSVAATKGGGGGGFGSIAGEGGNNGGAAGIVNGDPRLVPLRGGCPGGGGTAGGGALQLSAAGNLTITGTIAAAGRGGQGSPINIGGEGAGSGGGLLLEGLFVVVGGSGTAITANGGAGGEGGGVFVPGQDGANGSTRTADVAMGGDSVSSGGRGGNGAAGTAAATSGANSTFGAGTGGGGAGLGRLRINSANGCSVGGASVLSPRPTSNLDAGCT